MDAFENFGTDKDVLLSIDAMLCYVSVFMYWYFVDAYTSNSSAKCIVTNGRFKDWPLVEIP